MVRSALSLFCCLVSCTAAFAQPGASEAGIPVTDPLVIAKCGACHTVDQQGNMQRISWERTTPEGWQEALKRMILSDGVTLAPPEARSIVKYLSASHGLAPEEAEPIMYDAERRIHHETNIPNDHVDHACARCHNFAHALAHGKYFGEMQVDAAGDDEFTTTVHLTSVNDGSTIVRSGRSVVYGSYAWRGRSKGNPSGDPAANDVASDAREALWISPDQSTAEGRWFWGQYQEFGFDVKLRRPSSDPTLVTLDRSSLKTGSEANRIRLMGDRFPGQVAPTDLDFGPGVKVRRVVSSTSSEIVAELDVAPDATLGKRDVAFHHSVLPGAMAIYDRVDYIKIAPDSAMAAFGDQAHGRGFQQFEAVAYQRGPDGKLHTPDDVELGPVDPSSVTWSLEVFYSSPGKSTDFVGKISPSGFFTPASDNPKANFDVWAVATLPREKERPLVGKAYMVVTVPIYTLNGRQYIRDLDRWIDNGPAQ
ncbi:MAG: hypothetical protein ABSE57_31725 [Bryobacteraceae bacterium]